MTIGAARVIKAAIAMVLFGLGLIGRILKAEDPKTDGKH